MAVNNSIVDYLNSQKQDSSFSARSKLAAENKIANYTGTAQQNLSLLGLLRSKSTAAPAAPGATPTTTVNSPLPSSEFERAANMPDPVALVNSVNQQNQQNMSLSDKTSEVAKTVFNGNQLAIDNLRKQQQELVTKQKEEAQAKVDSVTGEFQKDVNSTQYQDALKRDRDLFKTEETIQLMTDAQTRLVQAQDALNVGLIYEGQSGRRRLQLLTGRQADLRAQGLATIGAIEGSISILQGNLNLAKSYADDTISAIKEDNAKRSTALSTLLTLYDKDLVSLTEEEKSLTEERIKTISDAEAKLEKNKEDVLELMQKYPKEFLKSGATLLDSKEEVIEKLLPHLSDRELQQNYQILEIGGRKKVYDPATQSIIKDLGAAEGGKNSLVEMGTDSFGNKLWGVYNEVTNRLEPVSVPVTTQMEEGELNTTVLNALEGIEFPSVKAKESAASAIKNLLRTGDLEEAKDLLKRYARNSLNGTQLDKITGKEDLLSTIDSIENKMAAFVAAGGKLNVFEGLSEKALEKGGFVKDPKLAQLANEIALAIIDYRKSVTGAAFSDSEKRAYDGVFPSIGKTTTLNQAKIDSLRETTNRFVDDFYKRALGESNWNALFNQTRTTPQLPPLLKNYVSVEALLRENPDYMSLYESIVEKDPNATDIEILQTIEEIGSESLSANFSPLAMSIVQQESGGNYQAVGLQPEGKDYTPADKALGRYQIIPKFHFAKIGLANTAENRQKFLNTPALQDKLFNAIITDLQKTYPNNPGKVAAAYYGGAGGAAKYGTPAGDKPQKAGGKTFPSINQYAREVLSRVS